MDCELDSSGPGTNVVALQVTADCTVVASQQGNAEYAAAPKATQRYVVSSLHISVTAQGPDPKTTLKVGGTASITVTLTAKWPILLGFVGFDARPDSTVCLPPNPWESIDSGTRHSISATFSVTLLAAGSCDIQVLPSDGQFMFADTAEVQFTVNP